MSSKDVLKMSQIHLNQNHIEMCRHSEESNPNLKDKYVSLVSYLFGNNRFLSQVLSSMRNSATQFCPENCKKLNDILDEKWEILQFKHLAILSYKIQIIAY